jgi:sec-independent protein translocase protein TatB
MFDMSWGEVMVIGGVALIVIGPKDLPKALRTVGQMTAKVRRLASEFQSQFSEAMREAELDEVRKEVEGLNREVAAATSTSFNPIQTIREELKTAVEAPASSAAPALAGPVGEGPSNTPTVPVEETGPIPHILPVAEVASPSAPLPIEPVVLPPPEPANLVGPGLEPASDGSPAASAPREKAQA